LQRGDRGADVGALRIVVPGDAAALGDELQPVRQAAERAQPLRQRFARGAERARQRARSKRVGGVVRAVDLQLG
jgi:hypothetical protein